MGFVNISLKNYRCFEDTSPLSADVGSGFTALVGPNNCGKSSFLKFFYEYRSIFQFDISQLVTILNQTLGIGFQGIGDPQEIPCNFNQRDGSIIFKFNKSDITLARSETGGPYYNSIELIFDWNRKNPGTLTGEFRIDGRKIPKDQNASFATDGLHIKRHHDNIFYMKPILDEVRKLGNSIYLGPFRNAINQGGGDYFDLSIGDQFIKIWNEWKTGPERQKNLAIEKVTEDIRNIFEFRKLEIGATSNGKELHINIDGYPYKLRELGAGLAQFILVFANAAIKQPSYIFIDEPELNLHPSLQVDFLTSLASYASQGIVFCTHSIGLARVVADRIYSLQRSGNAVRCAKFEQTPNYAEFVGEMSFASYKELGFERILLVEGQSEVKVMHQFLRMLKKDHKVVVIPLGGSQMVKGGVEQELAELKRITANVSAIIDSEKKDLATEPDQARKDFADCCGRLGIDLLLTEFRATENYFTEAAIKRAISPACRALAPYELLKGSSAQWPKSQNWRIAREMQWEDIQDTDLGRFLKTL